MTPQIPYAAIGIGIAVLAGVWAFVVADTTRERAFIAGAAGLIVLIGAIFRPPAGPLLTLFGWVVFGVGCIIFLRLKGLGIR
jgi:hypothetical protein